MTERLERLCLVVLRYGLPLAFLTPFLYTTDVTFPFVVSKVWGFRALVELLAPFYATLLIVSPRHRPWREPLPLAVLAFMAVLLLSTAFGVDPARSIWSNHERMTGVYTLLHYAAFFLMARAAYTTPRQTKAVLLSSLAASAVMAGVAFYERGHPGFLASTGGRVWATLGNTIYLANYLLFHLFFAALVAFRRDTRVWLRAVLGVLAAAEGLVILYTQTRGTLLAVLVSGAVLVSWAAVRNKKLRPWAAGVFIALAVAFGVLYLNRAEQWVGDIPGVGKLVRTTLTEGGGVRTRFIAWEIALKAFAERPLLGWGPENFYYAFNRFYNPESYRYGAYETWFDRSHNTLLDVLSMTGALGMLTYLALFAAAVWTVERRIKAGDLRRWEGMLSIGMLLAYVVQNLTVFDAHTSYLYFYLLLALIAARPLPEGAASESRLRAGLVALPVLLVGGIVLAIVTNLQPYDANRLGLRGTAIIRLRGHFPEAIDVYKKALETPSPHGVDLRIDAAREIANLCPSFTQGQAVSAKESRGTVIPITKDVVEESINWAIQQVEENRRVREDVYDALLYAELMQCKANYFGDRSALARARQALDEARALSPDRQQVVFAIVQLALFEGRPQDALDALEASLAKEERVRDLHWNLALAAHGVGDYEKAARAVARARELGYDWQRADDVTFAVDVFRKSGRLDEALAGAQLLASALPDEARAHLLLAEVHADRGEAAQAEAALARAVALDPGLAPQAAVLRARISR